VLFPVAADGRSPIDIAYECAEAACAIIREGFGRASVAAVKGRGNVVTETDFAAEQICMNLLAAAFPDHAILSEETASETRSDEWMWVVDPLDGTKNFSRGIPHFAFNLALCHEREPIIGLTAHPLLRDVFLAAKGEGCFLNGEPVKVAECESIAEAVVAIDMGYDAPRGTRQLELASALWPGMQSLRISGSAALGFAFVAAGKWDIYVHSDLQPWDIAAGLLLVREAGGAVHDRDGAEATIFSREAVCAGSPVLAEFERRTAGLRWDA
jgi:fructose-1,6-bisphosphatase/inositol monophosphatase family enzyme